MVGEWQEGKAGLKRVHDLRHTFGMRLRAAGVSFEDQPGLLGQKSDRMTTHYSRAQLTNLWEAANKMCDAQAMPKLTVLRTVAYQGRAKVAQGFLSYYYLKIKLPAKNKSKWARIKKQLQILTKTY